jgi:hypothetical protein
LTQAFEHSLSLVQVLRRHLPELQVKSIGQGGLLDPHATGSQK